MSDFVISNVDSAFIKVDCEKGFGKELSDFFTFTVPGHRYMPAFRKKIWDGKIKLFNYYKREIYAGLEDYVVQFARDRNYTVEGQRSYSENQQSLEASRAYTESLQPCSGGQELVPHEHQINAINHAINKNRCLLLSPTASGKSLIIYTLVRHYLERIGKNNEVTEDKIEARRFKEFKTAFDLFKPSSQTCKPNEYCIDLAQDDYVNGEFVNSKNIAWITFKY